MLLDTDRRRLTLTWYAELELPSLDAVPHLRIEARAPDAPAPQAAPAFDARQLLRKIAETPAGPPPAAPAHAPPQQAQVPAPPATRTR